MKAQFCLMRTRWYQYKSYRSMLWLLLNRFAWFFIVSKKTRKLDFMSDSHRCSTPESFVNAALQKIKITTYAQITRRDADRCPGNELCKYRVILNVSRSSLRLKSCCYNSASQQGVVATTATSAFVTSLKTSPCRLQRRPANLQTTSPIKRDIWRPIQIH